MAFFNTVHESIKNRKYSMSVYVFILKRSKHAHLWNVKNWAIPPKSYLHTFEDLLIMYVHNFYLPSSLDLFQLRVVHNLMYAMGNMDYADSQRQSSISLEVCYITDQFTNKVFKLKSSHFPS